MSAGKTYREIVGDGLITVKTKHGVKTMTWNEMVHDNEMRALQRQAAADEKAKAEAEREAAELDAWTAAEKARDLARQEAIKVEAEKSRQKQERATAEFNLDVMSGLMNGFWLTYDGPPLEDFEYNLADSIYEGASGHTYCYMILGGTVALRIADVGSHVVSDIRGLIERILGVAPLVSKDNGYLNLFYRAETNIPAHEDNKPRSYKAIASRYPTSLPVSVLGEYRRYPVLCLDGRGSTRANFETIAPFETPRFDCSSAPASSIERVEDERSDGKTTWRVTSEPVYRYGAAIGSIRWIDLPVITEALIDKLFAELPEILPPGLRVLGTRDTKRPGKYVPPLSAALVAEVLRPDGGIPIDAYTCEAYVFGIGRQVWAATEGRGFDLWAAWAARAGKAHGSIDKDKFERIALDKRWAALSHGDDGGRSIGVDSLLNEARLWGCTRTEDDNEVLTPYDFNAPTKAHKPWLIRDFVPATGRTLIIGQPGAGKSFIALDMALSIANDRPWMGKKVLPGVVIYIATEGEADFILRVAAWLKANNGSSERFVLLLKPVNFGEGEAGAKSLIALARDEALKRGEPVRAIIVDTLAATIGSGDENGQGVLTYVANAKTIAKATEAAVIILHHPAKSGGDEGRGHGSLRGDADASLTVRSSGEGGKVRRSLRVAKMRGGPDGATIGIHLETVTLDPDADGEPQTSLVVRPCAAPLATVVAKPRKMSAGQADALASLKSALDANGQEAPPEIAERAGASTSKGRVTTMAAWHEAARVANPDKKPDSLRRALDRNSAALIESGAVCIVGEFVWVA